MQNHRPGRRGQSLVELALILPILLIVLAAGLDLGRLFVGWVSLNNTARIAANYAATQPSGPFGAGSDYQTVVLRETTTMNCSLPAGPAPVPPPTFDPDTNVGSSATVEISCTFRLLTPILGPVVGNQVTLASKAIFAVRSGTIAGIPVPPPPDCTSPNLIVPQLIGLTVAQARSAWTNAGFTGSFIPANGHNNKIVNGQVPAVGTCRPPAATVSVTYE